MSDLIEDLDDLLRELVSRLEGDPVFGRLMDGTISRRHLVYLYTQIWHCLGVSTPALRAAGDSIARYGGDDPRFSGEAFARFKTPLYETLSAELRAHGQEEAGHDDWMCDDLVALGVPAAEVARSARGPAMSAYVAGIWNAALGPAPLGVAGQAYMLEGISELCWVRATSNLVAARRIPGIEHAVFCLREHGELDVGHCAKARSRLRRITDPRDQAAIVFNARLTIETWGRIGHEALCRDDGQEEDPRAA